jgi:hypothetical protein
MQRFCLYNDCYQKRNQVICCQSWQLTVFCKKHEYISDLCKENALHFIYSAFLKSINNLNTHLKAHCEHQLWLLSTQQELDQGWFEGRKAYLQGSLGYPEMPVQPPANNGYKCIYHTIGIYRIQYQYHKST